MEDDFLEVSFELGDVVQGGEVDVAEKDICASWAVAEKVVDDGTWPEAVVDDDAGGFVEYGDCDCSGGDSRVGSLGGAIGEVGVGKSGGGVCHGCSAAISLDVWLRNTLSLMCLTDQRLAREQHCRVSQDEVKGVQAQDVPEAQLLHAKQ